MARRVTGRVGMGRPGAKTILIVAHDRFGELAQVSYTVHLLSRVWQEEGIQVRVGYGTKERPPADIAINHVDLTRTPDVYLKLLRSYPVALNAEPIDISKTRFTSHLVRPDDGFEGPVIVKTDANFGGVHEQRLATRRDSRRWSRRRSLDSRHYPIFASTREVPPGVWENDRLLVQKFLPERDRAGNYQMRAWSFLGERGFHVRVSSSHPIIKGGVIEKREVLGEPVPQELSRLRGRLGLSYGRFDYVIVDGEVVVLDVNRTPTTSEPAARAYAAQLEDLARGIHDFW